MNAAPDTRPSARERQHAQALAAVGLPVTQLETPALVIDLAAMERNLQRMARFAQVHGLRLRPHGKSKPTNVRHRSRKPNSATVW